MMIALMLPLGFHTPALLLPFGVLSGLVSLFLYEEKGTVRRMAFLGSLIYSVIAIPLRLFTGGLMGAVEGVTALVTLGLGSIILVSAISLFSCVFATLLSKGKRYRR